MDGQEFTNLLRVANCLSHADFKSIFGEDHQHYINKLTGWDFNIGKFLMYLDDDNARRFYNHIEEKLEQQKTFRAS